MAIAAVAPVLLSKRIDTPWILGGATAVSLGAALLGVQQGSSTPVENTA